MADIAMLVAEEYERIVKSARKATCDSAGAGNERRRFEMFPVLALRLKLKFDAEKVQFLSYNWVLEPRTQIGVAASRSFFSA